MGKKISWDVALADPLGEPLAVYDQAHNCLGVGEFRPSKDNPHERVLAGRVVLIGR